jgi:hypothetical protein
MQHVNADIDPQFHIMTPQGSYWLAITLPPSMEERQNIFSLIGDYMAMMSATAFINTAQTKTPDAMATVGVKHNSALKGGIEVFGLYTMINHAPLTFTTPEILPPDCISDEITSILPIGTKNLTKKRIKEVDFWFGKNGHYRAVPYQEILDMIRTK